MDDLISRQAAIDALDKRFDSIPMEQTTEILQLRRDLRQLPPIQPKRGRWIYCEDSTADCVDGYKCDQCGFFVPWDYQHKSIDYIKDYHFCPNCRAKMGGQMMSDLIDRQQAIDALDGEITITGRANATAVKGYVNLVKDRLERLPSAQPEIVRCKDCTHWRSNTEFCTMFSGLNVAHRMPPSGFCSLAERREVTE